jgi:TPR repeat protein
MRRRGVLSLLVLVGLLVVTVDVPPVFAEADPAQLELMKKCHKEDASGCRDLRAMYHANLSDCEMGDARSCVMFGDGYAVDSVEAAYFFRKACDMGTAVGSARGCFYLGERYELGKGVSQSHDEALLYFGKACAMKLQVACKNYARLKTGKE